MIHDTIIIGAGLAGLTAAAGLKARGQQVLVIEKSRGLGGRAATRRWDGLPVDHGAQFFTARSPEFRAQVDSWLRLGICHEWSRGFHRRTIGGLESPSDHYPRYACRNGMNTLGRVMQGDNNIDVLREARAVAVRSHQKRWLVDLDTGASLQANRLVVSAPPPQGADLLAGASPEAAKILSAIAMHPCLAAVLRFPRRDLPWAGIQCDDAPVAWIAHDTSKRPDLHPGKTVVVIHASAEYSRACYAEPEDEIVRDLAAHASVLSGEDLESPDASFLQRWRYANPATPPEGEPARVIESPVRLILAGESFAGGKIEGAWLSGSAAAEMAG